MTSMTQLLPLHPPADGAPAGDAEPDEGAADGHADRLVQGVPQVLRHLLHAGLAGPHGRVSPARLELWWCAPPPSLQTQFCFFSSSFSSLLNPHLVPSKIASRVLWLRSSRLASSWPTSWTAAMGRFSSG